MYFTLGGTGDIHIWKLHASEDDSLQMILASRSICFCSIAEYSVDNSIIKPTYMLTYESASELLHLNLDEEVELKILSEAATLRSQWRREQVIIR